MEGERGEEWKERGRRKGMIEEDGRWNVKEEVCEIREMKKRGTGGVRKARRNEDEQLGKCW